MVIYSDDIDLQLSLRVLVYLTNSDNFRLLTVKSLVVTCTPTRDTFSTLSCFVDHKIFDESWELVLAYTYMKIRSASASMTRVISESMLSFQV